MTEHCQSCLTIHTKRVLIGVLMVLDLILSALQLQSIIHDPNPGDAMMRLVLGLSRTLITWALFAVAVTTLNRALRCHTDKGQER